MLYIVIYYGIFRALQILSFFYDLISRTLPRTLRIKELNLIGFEDKNI